MAVIHKNTLIGKNCVIESIVSIGGRNKNPHVPIIEDNVFIGTGMRIIRDVHFSVASIIRVNSVVMHDIPSNCSVLSASAKDLHENIDIDKKCNISRNNL